MNIKKSKEQLAEEQLRLWVRKSIKDNVITEDYDDAWAMAGFGGLIDAWKPLFQTLNLGAQAILSNVITQLRLFTTFNGRKAQQIRDRQKDRNQRFKEEMDAIETPIGLDMAGWMFALNPGAAIAYGLGKGVEDAHVVDWLKKAGVGDFAIDELESGGHVAKRKRKEDEQGVVGKLLRNLEDLFTLRMGAENEGNLLTEAAANDIANIIGPELAAGEFGKKFAKEKENLMASAQELSQEIEGVEAQIDFLKNLGNLGSLEELSASVDKLKQMAPKADLGAIDQLPQELKKDAENMVKDEDAKTEAAKNILARKGVEEPSEEEIGQVPEKEIAAELEAIAFANAVSGFRQGAGEQIQEITKIYTELMEEMFPPVKGIQAAVWEKSEYGKNIEKIKARVKAFSA